MRKYAANFVPKSNVGNIYREPGTKRLNGLYLLISQGSSQPIDKVPAKSPFEQSGVFKDWYILSIRKGKGDRFQLRVTDGVDEFDVYVSSYAKVRLAVPNLLLGLKESDFEKRRPSIAAVPDYHVTEATGENFSRKVQWWIAGIFVIIMLIGMISQPYQ